MTNYFNPSSAITSIDLNLDALSDKGQQQVREFYDFCLPLIDDIRSGDNAKAKIAYFYLDNIDRYTEGVKDRLSVLIDALDISKGYMSKLRSARKYLGSLNNQTIKTYVEEHPVSVQYLLKDVPYESINEKMMTGEHFKRTEVEALIKNEKGQLDKAEPETKSDFQRKLDRADELVADTTEYPFIRTRNQALTYLECSGRKAAFAVACQYMYEMKWHDPELEAVLKLMKAGLAQVSKLPKFEPKKIGDYS